MKKITTLLLALSLGTLFGCGNSNIAFPTSGDTTQPIQPGESIEDIVRNNLPEDMEEAPKLTIPHITSSKASQVVPITVEDFFEIGCYELTLLYDPDIMTATEVSPGVAYWAFVPNLLAPGQIKIAWLFFQAGSQGHSLPNGSAFVNITFQKITEGVSDITFDHSYEYGNIACDWDFNQMYDEPHEYFYNDGSLEFE